MLTPYISAEILFQMIFKVTTIEYLIKSFRSKHITVRNLYEKSYCIIIHHTNLWKDRLHVLLVFYKIVVAQKNLNIGMVITWTIIGVQKRERGY